MSDGYPTAARKEALRLICTHGLIPGDLLAEELLAAREPGAHPGYAAAIRRMAGTLAWRLEAQGFIAEAGAGTWRTTAAGRDVIACTT
ncbi:hypothetical protein [Nonomuraea sp. C10]|uniref:hypothetical protein n=1 Tax=Nonomuraea sp. C10 TaxID=2600577 RepID=UPI0011CD64FD|nr:hypothetical protein [Nonomuraea sp. C10]TXK40043.1 hypothetical protein FR742_10980 [Nonomuraea sp. C10]